MALAQLLEQARGVGGWGGGVGWGGLLKAIGLILGSPLGQPSQAATLAQLLERGALVKKGFCPVGLVGPVKTVLPLGARR
jgi:hypothetical protein